MIKKRKKPVYITEEEVYETIIKYHAQWKMVPTASFLVQYFNVSRQTIWNKLDILEKKNKLKKIAIIDGIDVFVIRSNQSI